LSSGEDAQSLGTASGENAGGGSTLDSSLVGGLALAGKIGGRALGGRGDGGVQARLGAGWDLSRCETGKGHESNSGD